MEGSISTPEQAEEIVRLRAATSTLVTIGACATAGGIQALRNWATTTRSRRRIPRSRVRRVTREATPVADHVAVDAELRGCPISPDQLREFLTAIVAGRRPNLPDEAVCRNASGATSSASPSPEGVTCLGPVTRSGCGALCPAYGRGCYGCFGPRESANSEGLATWLGRDRDAADTARCFALFNAWSPPFRRSIDAAGGPPGPVDGRSIKEPADA